MFNQYADEEGNVGGGGPSLFDQYASSAGNSRGPRGPGTTRSAMLRAQGVRLNCYLNCEGVGVTVIGGPQGHGTIVKLPEACDTIAEVLIYVQKQMKLDARMLYASELWTPSGDRVKSFKQLADVASLDTPIIIGCGEPFDGSRIPQDLLEFHKEGGGRSGPRSVHKQLKSRRQQALRDKAETVRAAGHGINSEAVSVARFQNVEVNKEHVNEMRHKYMESLLIRAAQQEDLMSSVKSNIEYHRMEAAESKARLEEKRTQRAEALRAERKQQKQEMEDARREQMETAQRKAAKVRAGEKALKNKPKGPRKPSKSSRTREMELHMEAVSLS